MIILFGDIASILWILAFDLLLLVLCLLGISLLLLLLMGALAPFESLGWWAGWSGHEALLDRAAFLNQKIVAIDSQQHRDAACYVVYLSGIGDITGDTQPAIEMGFLKALQAHIPDMVLVDDVFPYAMDNRGLTGQRLFSKMWRGIKRLQLEGRGTLSALINIRNMFQVLVSADRRYGPIYNYGVGEVIAEHLLRQGYQMGSGKRVTLIGYSGGGQISIGTAAYLQTMLQGAPLQVISIGGVMSDDPGLDAVDHLFHFYGTKDSVQKIGEIVYAGRWPLLPYSPWNRAKKAGRITMLPIGPIGHTGSGAYFDPESRLPDGQSFLNRTADVVARTIQEQNNLISFNAGM